MNNNWIALCVPLRAEVWQRDTQFYVKILWCYVWKHFIKLNNWDSTNLWDFLRLERISFSFFFLSLLHNWILFHLFMDQSHKILSLIFSIANGKCTCNRVGCLFPEILSTNLSLFSSEMKRVFKKLKFSVRFRPNRQFRFGSTRSEGFGFLIKQNKM